MMSRKSQLKLGSKLRLGPKYVKEKSIKHQIMKVYGGEEEMEVKSEKNSRYSFDKRLCGPEIRSGRNCKLCKYNGSTFGGIRREKKALYIRKNTVFFSLFRSVILTESFIFYKLNEKFLRLIL